VEAIGIIAAPGRSKVTVALSATYPVPADVILTPVTAPPLTVAVATAPVPLVPPKVTNGGVEEYPAPPAVIEIAVILPASAPVPTVTVPVALE